MYWSIPGCWLGNGCCIFIRSLRAIVDECVRNVKWRIPKSAYRYPVKVSGTSEVMIVSKKFLFWFFTTNGITGAIIAITGISWLFYFSPLARTHHLNVMGYLTLAFFIFVLVFSGYVFSRRNQFREDKSPIV